MRKITREDALRSAIWSYGVEKSLGFDEFNFKFFREMWEEIGGEIFDFVTHFLKTSVFPEPLNVTWVTLIPKVSNPEKLKDFKPISLVGSLYKVVAKLLSMRVKEVMSQVIDEI